MSSETTHAGRQKQIVFLFGQRVSECQLVWFGSSVQIAHRRFLRLLDGVPSLSSWWMPQSVKSTFACSHQVAASCHAVPSAVERDGRLLELDELPMHVAEPQSPVLLHPLQSAVLSLQLILTTLYGCRSGTICAKSLGPHRKRSSLFPKRWGWPVLRRRPEYSVPRSIWAPQNCPVVSSWPLRTGSPALRYQCWSFSARSIRGSRSFSDIGRDNQWWWRQAEVAQARRHSHVHEKNTHPCKQGHTNWCWKHGELWRLIVQQCAQQHILQLCLHADQNWQNCWISTEDAKDTRKHGRQKEYRIVKHETRPLLQNTTVDCPYNSWKKLRHLWPSENVETLSHTDVRKITPTLTKCLDRADTLQKHRSFHSGRLRGGARDQFMDQVDKRTPVDLGPAATERLDRRGVLTFTHIWTLLKHSLAFCSWTLEDTAHSGEEAVAWLTDVLTTEISPKHNKDTQ